MLALCRVIITKTDPEPCVAERCLETEGILFETREVRGAWGTSEGDYARILADVWRDGETFINLEHDVAPWPGALELLYACHHPLCYCRYPHWQGLVRGLGCVKFSRELLRDVPWRWGEATWQVLDSVIVNALDEAGYPGHEHLPPVAHARGPAFPHVAEVARVRREMG